MSILLLATVVAITVTVITAQVGVAISGGLLAFATVAKLLCSLFRYDSSPISHLRPASERLVSGTKDRIGHI